MDQIFLALAFTTHLGLVGDYNEIHPHVRYTHDNYITGAYYNSMNRLSVYAGYRYEINDFGVEAVVASGYDEVATFVPSGRLTYSVNDNTTIFGGPVLENYDNNLEHGLLLGIEFMID